MSPSSARSRPSLDRSLTTGQGCRPHDYSPVAGCRTGERRQRKGNASRGSGRDSGFQPNETVSNSLVPRFPLPAHRVPKISLTTKWRARQERGQGLFTAKVEGAKLWGCPRQNAPDEKNAIYACLNRAMDRSTIFPRRVTRSVLRIFLPEGLCVIHASSFVSVDAAHWHFVLHRTRRLEE